jgi:hypothetical protein
MSGSISEVSAPVERRGFCVFISTVCEGLTPAVRNGEGMPDVFATEAEAQREIVDSLMTRLEEFMDGERDFDDAVTVEEFILPVQVLKDGTVIDEEGRSFGKE